MAHEVLRTLWAESALLSRRAEKAQEEATSQLEIKNTWKVARSRSRGAASVTELLQPRRNGNVAPAKA